MLVRRVLQAMQPIKQLMLWNMDFLFPYSSEQYAAKFNAWDENMLTCRRDHKNPMRKMIAISWSGTARCYLVAVKHTIVLKS